MARLLSMHPDPLAPIVFVDDEAALVRDVGALLREAFGASRVRATTDPDAAAAWLEEGRPGALIADARMPGVSGLELLAQAREAWGPTPTVLLASEDDPALALGAGHGAVCLAKPFAFAELLQAVRDVMATPPDAFQGPIAVATLADILRLYASSGVTGTLAVTSGGCEGEITLERGLVTHATTGGAEGFEAFRALLAWPRGEFAWNPRSTEQQTIQMSASALIMEAYRVNDEEVEPERTTVRPPPLALEVGPASPAQPTLRGVPAEAEAPVRALAPSTAPRGSEGPRASDSDRVVAAAAEPLLNGLGALEGFVSAALVDGEDDATIGAWGDDASPHATPRGSALLLDLMRATLDRLALEDEIEDVVLTLSGHYELMRPLRRQPKMFLYLALDRERANLAHARMRLALGEGELVA